MGIRNFTGLELRNRQSMKNNRKHIKIYSLPKF